MPKNYERNPEQAGYIKRELMKKYPEIFQKYEMTETPRDSSMQFSRFSHQRTSGKI